MNKYISLAVIATCVTFSACNNEKAAETTKTVVSAVPIIPTASNLHTLTPDQIKSIAPDSIWSFKLTPDQIASLTPDQKNALRYAIAGAMANIVYTEVSKYEQTGVDPDLMVIGLKQGYIDENYPDVFTFDENLALAEIATKIVEDKGAEYDKSIALNRAKSDSLDNVIAQADADINKSQAELQQSEDELKRLKDEGKKLDIQNAILKSINASVSQNTIASN